MTQPHKDQDASWAGLLSKDEQGSLIVAQEEESFYKTVAKKKTMKHKCHLYSFSGRYPATEKIIAFDTISYCYAESWQTIVAPILYSLQGRFLSMMQFETLVLLVGLKLVSTSQMMKQKLHGVK